MANLQIFKHYKQLIEIDYFTLFIRSYLALNAYLKGKFDGKDREKIDQLKEDCATLHRFKELLDKEEFLTNLGEFKKALYESQIKNEGIVVSFERVKIQSFNPKNIPSINYNSIKYELKIIGGKDEKVNFKCYKANVEQPIDKECRYAELEKTLNETNLSKTQRDKIKSLFDNEIGQYHQDLNPIIDNIENGSDENKTLVAKGFIEIIYLLRNALFHTEIDPTQHSINNVYKFAYILLKDFVNRLPEETR